MCKCRPVKCGQTRHSPSKPPTLSASLSLSSRLTGCPCFIQPATVCRPQGNERRRGRPVSRSQDGADAGRAWRGAPGGRLLGTPHLGAVCMASTPTGVFHLGLGPQAGPSFAQQRAPAAGSSQASWPLDTRPSGLCFNAPSSRKSPQTKPGTLASPAPEAFSHIAAVITVTQLPPAWMPVCCLPPPASPPGARTVTAFSGHC